MVQPVKRQLSVGERHLTVLGEPAAHVAPPGRDRSLSAVVAGRALDVALRRTRTGLLIGVQGAVSERDGLLGPRFDSRT